ncbi:uncharacterized protein LOC142139871 [Mixophyes fleayi]|uniref:uncharacterized protein LOC142139871 n=1 Tax=Mixophyes fleayi TaxID=3061075 RepID=UPI003F4DE12F
MDELLHWLEVRITSSLKPRVDEMKNLLLDHTYRSYLCEFLKNEDVHTLYVYFKLAKASLAATLTPPPALQNKCICFVKLGTAIKLSLENIANHVMSVDCAKFPLKYFDTVLHQVYLPLLCIDNSTIGTYSTDKIIDILHRFTGNLEVIAGHAEGSIVLPVPSLELLKNTPLFNKSGAAIHIMETTVIGWIRQIKVVLKHDPLAEVKARGVTAGIYHEKEMWEIHINNLESIILQLNSAEAREIIYLLKQAKSMYGNSIAAVTQEVLKAHRQAKENLTFLKTLSQCYDQLNSAKTTTEKQKYFFPMLHCLFLVWTHSRYYHKSKVFINLLRLMSNEVVEIAGNHLGRNILGSPQAYSLLKEALKICATFRGNYLDVKIKADDLNAKKMTENDNLNKSNKSKDTVRNITMYEVPAPWVYGRDQSIYDKKQEDKEEAVWINSPWPLYNAPCFQNINMFMERCNDVLDLVETMKHVEVLKAVAAIGGAGSSNLDTMVQEIWSSYCLAKDSFTNQITDMFAVEKNSPFQKAFFELRTTIKSLEHQLGNILRSSFDQCPTIASQLRLLELFEGVSRRDIVKDHLKDKDLNLLNMFIEEISQVKDMYQEMADNPPLHVNMTPTISKLLWIKGLRARISEPMAKLRTMSPLTLEGDMGWELRHLYTDLSEELERFENSLMTSWLSVVNTELSDSLKLPLLIASSSAYSPGDYLHTIEINLHPDLLVYLRDAEYFLKPPFTMKLPESLESLISKMDTNKFKMLSTRLETVVSKYNEVIKTISHHQKALFEKKLLKIFEILRDGLSVFTWSMDENADYTELATSYICTDLYNNFSIVTNNNKLISELTAAWCTTTLDIFTCREFSRSYSITELVIRQKEIEHELTSLLIPDGQKIHSLVEQSFDACGISEASPAWQEFIMHIDAIVLQGLKKVTISSLAALLNTLLDSDHVAILSVEVELINGEVAFNPPLDQSTSDTSVMENIEEWLKMFLFRGSQIKGLSSMAKVGYQDYVSEDNEALQLIGHILQQVENGVLECKAFLEVFGNYSCLWKNDVNKEFQLFLHGKQRVEITPGSEVEGGALAPIIRINNNVRMKSHNNPLIIAERAFIFPKDTAVQMTHGPLLEDFDSEISAYKAARDSIQRLPDHQQCRWIQVDFQPIKQVLSAYALKWMWIFTKYLIDQTCATLKSLDSFLRRTEPQIESITGEERDTGSFMRMMHLFNEVSSKQAEMEVQFIVLQRTVTLLGKHEMALPADSEVLYKSMPARWNSMKTKVSLAKQRLGPRIQQEADIVTRDLEQFQQKLDILGPAIETSHVYKYECTSQEAFGIIQNFSTQVQVLQNEAKDLKELQELLETTVVDFSILNNCEDLLHNLSLVWQHVDSILKEQGIWKKDLWQDMGTEELYKKTKQHLTLLQSLPGEVQEWDVYKQALDAVNIMHLTLPLIEDLSNPAMRTRHWKQLVRHTGGMLRVTAESLKAMTLGDLLAMDLQKHTGDVRTTVQRAMRDVTIENSLKNCEEVWLSRIFDLSAHSRVISAGAENEEIASSVSGSHCTIGRNLRTGKGSRRNSKQSDRGLLSRKAGRGSTMSLYESLKHIEEFGKVLLLRNTDSVFEELEHHQLVLTSIQPYAEAGSFLDEVTKWQKKLQVIETTVQLWLSVQNKWTQLEEVFSTLAFRVALPREAILFADVHHHFCRLMKSVEENPNILQNCMRRGLQSLLDMLNYKLMRCQRAVRLHLERKRQAFPRLFFLSLEETLNIVCYGYDLDVLSNYIVKIFQHVHSLIYQASSEQESHHILGVRSFLGEELNLVKPLECSGPVEIWLPQLVNSINASLQHQVSAAVDTNIVTTRRKEIHSAGARRVVISKTVSTEEAAADKRKISASSIEEKSFIGSGHGESQESKHWVLNTLSDVAYLSTQIKFSREYSRNDEHRNTTLQGCLKDLTEGIEYAAKILNEIPQKDIQLLSERTSKAERKENGQGEGENLGKEQDTSLLAPKPTLSPGDAVKLTNHILLLLYQRDVASQILSGIVPIWKQGQPLCYEYDASTKDIVVKIGDSEIHYGYEYQGSAEHILITPLTERIFLSVMGAVTAGIDALCIGPQASGKKSTIRELALALGKPLFCFNCTKTSDPRILQDICKGLAAAGAWVCINGLEQLSQHNLSLLAQLITQIQSAKHAGKEKVTLQLEEVPLNTAGTCIAIIKRSPSGTVRGNNYTHLCKFPDSLLSCFRIVGVSEFPVNFIVEAKLLLKGFSHVAYLAQKLSAILGSFGKLYKEDVTGSGSSENGKYHGSSKPELNNLIEDAGNILKSLHKCHIESQEQEFAGGDDNWQRSLEDRAVVTAIQNCWLTQLSEDRAHLLSSFVAAEWPYAVMSLNTSHGSDMVTNNLDGLIPAVIVAKYGPGQQVPSSECTEEGNVPSAIIKAGEKCHIFPSNTFVFKVSHLVHLAPKYQTVVVTGPAGCGKTTCIKTFLETLRGEGKKVRTDTVYTKALQSGHFLGFMNKSTGWIDGLLPQLLRTYCQPCTIVDDNQMNILHLDGEVNGHEVELMENLFCSAEFFVCENNERIRIPDSFLLLWELETLANVSPSVLCCMGILAMTSDDMDWKLPLKIWMRTHAEHEPLLLQLTETFLEPSLQFLRDNHLLPQPGDERQRTPRDLFLCEASVVQTFCRISEALTQHVPEMLPEDMKKYFIFSCIWSFGSWLDSHEKAVFSNWWRQTFRNLATFPAEGEVWDYHIDTEAQHFVRWHDTLSSHSGSHGQSMASEAFVHTMHSERLLYLSSLLTTSGYPVLLAGEAGCGKSILSQELLNCLCLGDVSEMSELRIPINSSTDPRRLWGYLKDRLEWRHGTLHTPAGNKKLLCLVDDLNLAKVNEHGSQPACEFVRQLLDQERIFDPISLSWKMIKGIIYLATWNITRSEGSPTQRLLRHFCTFLCKYPSHSEQLGIFSSILNAHFVPGVTEHKAGSKGAVAAEPLQELIIAITKVSIELQERLRTVFLGTSQRCHYIFTLRDLAKIFRNICLSLDGGTTTDKLLLLWRHECDWVFGQRMSSSVDYSRFVQELTIAVQKVFINEEQVELILRSQQPFFSNIVEDDGGLITTAARQQDMNLFRRSEKPSSTTHILDGYLQTFDLVHVKQLLTEALREYNKVNPRMSITFYQCAIILLCRLARNLWSSQGSAHTLLCGEGCPRYSTAIAQLASHLAGFNVVQLGSHIKTVDEEQRNRNLKSQLVDCYVKAGLKGQRTLLLLTEEGIDPTVLVYITEFVVFGSVSHLFTSEQQATIANAMRSEVTNAGLTYSKESAWNLFLQSVQQNIRWFLIRSDIGSTFYKWCLQFSSLVNALNVYYIPQWSQENLIEHASYHIQDLDMLTKQEIENVCHLLSSMHLSIIKHVKSAKEKYGNITNATFDFFVQCFRTLMKEQYAKIIEEHKLAKEVLGCIEKKLTSHEKLTDDLMHENIVLEQHKEGTLKILQQIAQDKAVVEQKIHDIHQQLQKIKKFKSLLPEYQVALEKAEYKCSALIENIKQLVQNMDITALGELRAMQKPDVDIEELMASVIIILKSPNTDLTWAKGAKRQMANIDRFLNELVTFHMAQLPQSTLELLETNIRKVQFTPENMERKAFGNVAAGSLMRWLQSAVRYYRILTSKVKPLQSKVSEMTIALEEAEQKMSTLQQRKKAFNLRLANLGKGFEEATIHKNKQQQRAIEIALKLDQAARIAQLLEEENKKYSAIVKALPDRLSGIPGSTAMAAGLVSYLGAYEHNFRQLMLTVEWPTAVKERGFPLMIDSVDPNKGHVIEFSVVFASDSPMDNQKIDHNTEQKEVAVNDRINGENNIWYANQGETTSTELPCHSQCLPIITEELYLDFIKALIMRIVKPDDIQKWSANDWTSQQMENAAILSFSCQRPVLLVDPCFKGETLVQDILGTSPENPFSTINLQARQDSSILAPIEKAILSSGPLILYNYCNKWDDLLMPLIDHCCAAHNRSSQQGSSSIISFNGHRLLCADHLKLYLAAYELEPRLSTEINSGTTIVNYSFSEESLIELLMRRAFAIVQPHLYIQFMEKANLILKHQQDLKQLEKKSRECFISPELSNMYGDVNIITISEEKSKISRVLEMAKSQLNKMLQVREALYPLAQQGALFYSILKSLRSLADEYDFTLDFFLKLFDCAIGAKSGRKEDYKQMESAASHEDSLPPSLHLSDKIDQPIYQRMADAQEKKENRGAVPAHQPPISPAEPHNCSLSTNHMRKVVDQLTQAVYQVMIQSLLPEHSTLACALLFLCTHQMENKYTMTEEELAFFSKGSCAFNTIKLETFISNISSPPWLPHERWEELMTLSASSVHLKQLCVQIAENPSEWNKWYNSDYPDVGNSDGSGNEESAEKGVIQLPACGDMGCQLDDFHRLLVIRAVRPDRFPNALCRWVERSSSDLELHDLLPGIENIAELEQNTLGVLVIEPSSRTKSPSYGDAILSCKANLAICRAAKEKSIPLFIVSIKNGNEEEIKTAINDTMNQNGWLIIENVHLASKAMLKNLHKYLGYAAKMRVSHKEERQFCVWLTSELGTYIPQEFLAHLKKVSWHFLMLNQTNRKTLMSDVLYIDSLPRLLYSAIVSALDQMEEEICERVKFNPNIIQRLCFGICVLHGVLQTQWKFPRTGLNHLIYLGPKQLNQSLNAVLSTYDKMKTWDNDFSGAVAEAVNSVYTCLTLTSVDIAYIQTIVHEIISSSQQHQEFLVINHLSIPIPPPDVDPAQYSSWLIDHMPANDSCKELLLPRATERAADDTYASEFMQDLSAMCDAMSSSLPLIIPEDHNSVKQLADLRTTCNTVLEQLPPLIQIDVLHPSFKNVFSSNHGTAEDQISKHILLQECNWMNTNLKHIKNSVSMLSNCLLGGVTAIPEDLRDAADALENAVVPRSWLPSHSCQTSHNIIPWLEGLHMTHKQLKQWVKKGLMPFAKSEKGALTSINLGRLVNPEALLLALRVEFAVHHGYLLHEVVLQCHITEYPDYKPDSDVYALYLEGLVLQGAAWDFRNNQLKESRNLQVHPLPFVIITPMLLRNMKPSEDGTEVYECPVYLDLTMQHCVMRLPLLGTKPIRQWHLSRVAIILNPDVEVNTSGRAAPTMKQIRRGIPVINSVTKVDKSSHSRIFNRASKSKDCLLVQADSQETSRITGNQNISTERELNHSLLFDEASESTAFQQDLKTDVVSEKRITVSRKNSVSNQNDKFIRDVNDKNQMLSVADEKDDDKELKMGLSEGTGFIAFQSDGAEDSKKKPFIREHLMVHTRNSDNEHGHGCNNGNFDGSENKEYKGEFDKWRDTFNESLPSNNDHEAGENQAGYNYGQDNVRYNEEDFNCSNDSSYVNAGDDNTGDTRGHIVNSQEAEEIL